MFHTHRQSDDWCYKYTKTGRGDVSTDVSTASIGLHWELNLQPPAELKFQVLCWFETSAQLFILQDDWCKYAKTEGDDVLTTSVGWIKCLHWDLKL